MFLQSLFIRSVFSGYNIPYPKREFLTDEEQEDKSDKVLTEVKSLFR